VWSPDGVRIAFTSARGDHGFIGVYDVAANSLRYVDPSTDDDREPEWSPDGRSIAFLRVPSSGVRAPREAHRTGEPWSIRIASAETGEGREIWRAAKGPGSVFRGVTARNQLLWADGGHIIFPWEADGWTHLYAIPAAGGKATLLTPGAFEVEDVALAPSRQSGLLLNQGDIDRRHLWKVAAEGARRSRSPRARDRVHAGAAERFQCRGVAEGGRSIQHPAIRVGGSPRSRSHRDSADFLRHMVTPQGDVPRRRRTQLHGQLFLPPKQAASVRAPAVVFFYGGSRRQMMPGWHYMYYYSNAYAMNQYLANSGYVVLSVNYRSGIGYGMEFREALNYGASGGTEYNDVQGAGIYLRGRPDVDPARIGAWGGSYGGYLVAMALARAGDLYKAGVDFHGVHNWATELNIPVTEPDYKIAFESSPMAFLKTWRSPVLLIQGDDDRRVQFNQTVMLAGALRKQGVEIEELVIPDEGHDFLLHRSWKTTYEATARFLQRHLK
jgi:dipeptidyl aminopeptidase/acylaminoacyl peptidase